MKEYTYEILSLYTAPSVDNLSSVVKRVTWRYQVKDGIYVADIYKDTYFNSADPSNFINYDELTPEIIFGWISKVEDIFSIQNDLDTKLLLVKNPVIVEKEIPWNNVIGYTGQELFIITSENKIILGPIKWDSSEFNKILSAQGITLPSNVLAYKQGIVPKDMPLELNDILKIYQVGDIVNNTGFENVLFNNLNDIDWNFASGKAIGTYTPSIESIEHIKTILKQNLRNKLDILEMTHIAVKIDDIDFNISATNWGRLFVITKLIRLQDGELCDWYNNKVKIKVSKEQLMKMLITIDDYIDSLLDIEIPKIVEIDNCQTIEQLKQITI